MEIKATLTKPYTDIQRADFIVENNHNLGYEIRETETELQAWGLTEEEKEEQERRNALLKERDELTTYLSETDWTVVKCMERGLNIQEEYPEAYQLRGEARIRIDEIDEELK